MNRYPADRYRRAARSEPYRREPSIPPFDQLDQGIRELVRLLWIAGFNPTDSGDGVTKQGMDCALDVPHVFMVPLDPAAVYDEANRLHAFVVDVLGLWLDPVGMDPDDHEPITLEASYDPATGTAVLALLGVDDELLKANNNRRLLFPEARRS